MMRLVLVLSAASCAFGQGRPVDWASFGGDGQRSGWEKSDTRITKDNVKNFEMVLKRKFVPKGGAEGLTPPVVVGMLISFRGFKELGIVADNSETVSAIDLDLNRVFWQRKFATPGAAGKCAATVAAMPGLVPPTSFGGARKAGPKRPTILGAGFGQVRPVFAVSNDGKLHRLNTADGTDLSPAMEFLPPGARGTPLTIFDGTLYSTTRPGCGDNTGIYAIDLTVTTPKMTSFAWQGAPSVGMPAMGTEGVVYVQTGAGESDPASNKWADSLLAFSANDLKLTGHMKIPGGGSSIAPVVFGYQDRDVVVGVTGDGRLYLADSANMTEPLAQSPVVGKLSGGLASWQDASGTRWVLAPVWSKVSADVPFAMKNGDVTHGALAAFKVEEQGGKTVFTPAWLSRDMAMPMVPVMTGGAVFTVATGGHAVFYGIDGDTGKELYSSGSQVVGAGSVTGLTIANGRVFFAAADGTLYGFGIHLEI